MHLEEENGLGKVGVAGNGSIIQKKQAAKEVFPRRMTQVGPGPRRGQGDRPHPEEKRRGKSSCSGLLSRIQGLD